MFYAPPLLSFSFSTAAYVQQTRIYTKGTTSRTVHANPVSHKILTTCLCSPVPHHSKHTHTNEVLRTTHLKQPQDNFLPKGKSPASPNQGLRTTYGMSFSWCI